MSHHYKYKFKINYFSSFQKSMWSSENTIFFAAFILGAFVYYLLMRWNDKKLSPEQLKEIRNEFSSSKPEWILPMITGLVVTGSIQIQKALGYESLGWVIPLCFFGVLLARRSVEKDMCFAKFQIPLDYIRADRNIVFFASVFFTTLGLLNFIIFLRSEFF